MSADSLMVVYQVLRCIQQKKLLPFIKRQNLLTEVDLFDYNIHNVPIILQVMPKTRKMCASRFIASKALVIKCLVKEQLGKIPIQLGIRITQYSHYSFSLCSMDADFLLQCNSI